MAPSRKYKFHAPLQPLVAHKLLLVLIMKVVTKATIFIALSYLQHVSFLLSSIPLKLTQASLYLLL